MKYRWAAAVVMMVASRVAHAQWIPLPPEPPPMPAPVPADPWENEPPASSAPPSESSEPQAVAEPEADPPPLPPTPAAPRYPASVAMRPLLLPRGTVQLALSVSLFTMKTGFDYGRTASALYGAGTVNAIVSTGTVELGAVLEYSLFDSQTSNSSFDDEYFDFATVPRLGAFVRALVGDELSVGSFVVLGNVDTERQSFSPNLTLTKKWHLSENAAIELFGGIDYTRAVYGRPFDQRTYSSGSLFSELSVVVQVAPRVGLVSWFDATEYVLFEDLGLGYMDYRGYQTGLRAVIAVSDAVDVGIHAALFRSLPPAEDSKSIGFALTLRRLP